VIHLAGNNEQQLEINLLDSQTVEIYQYRGFYRTLALSRSDIDSVDFAKIENVESLASMDLTR